MFSFYRVMRYRVKRGIAIVCRLTVTVCLSVICDVGGSGPQRLETLETNCREN